MMERSTAYLVEKRVQKKTSRKAKQENPFWHIKKLKVTLILLSMLFISLSCIGVYFIGTDGVDIFYKYIVQFLLVCNMILLFVFRELWKQEKTRMRYFGQYTFMAHRK